MITNGIIAVLTLFLLHQTRKQYLQVLDTLRKLRDTPVLNVSQVIKQIKENPSRAPLFVVLKGILRATQSLNEQSEKHIFSVIDIKDLRDRLSVADAFSKVDWEQLIQKPFHRKPWDLRNVVLDIQDFTNAGDKIQIKNCVNSSISGALSEVVRHQIYPTKRQNIITYILKNLANLFTFFPLNIVLKKFKFAEQMSYYAILDGQYSLVIGKAILKQGKVVIRNPDYITKQKGYIENKLLYRLKKIHTVLILLLSILILVGYKIIKWLWRKFMLYRDERQIREEEIRSQDEGDHCNCIICFTNVRNIILKPCRHYAVCAECYRSLRNMECPICKQLIDGHIRVVKR